MTVEDLIIKLSEIEDKTMEVCILDNDCNSYILQEVLPNYSFRLGKIVGNKWITEIRKGVGLR